MHSAQKPFGLLTNFQHTRWDHKTTSISFFFFFFSCYYYSRKNLNKWLSESKSEPSPNNFLLYLSTCHLYKFEHFSAFWSLSWWIFSETGKESEDTLQWHRILKKCQKAIGTRLSHSQNLIRNIIMLCTHYFFTQETLLENFVFI